MERLCVERLLLLSGFFRRGASKDPGRSFWKILAFRGALAGVSICLLHGVLSEKSLGSVCLFDRGTLLEDPCFQYGLCRRPFLKDPGFLCRVLSMP